METALARDGVDDTLTLQDYAADASPLAAVYREKVGTLRTIARGLTGDGEEAADLVQEAFVRVHRTRRAPTRPDDLYFYLLRVLVNLVRNKARRDRLTPRVVRSVVADMRRRDTHHRLDRIGPSDRPDLLAALQFLPLRQREAVFFRFWLDLSAEQTAMAMGVSLSAAKTHTARAVARLRTMLEGQEQ